MRALAHPARLLSIQHLMMVGPSTATELAEVAGLTPSAMSYHLRSLERAGLIETAPGRGDGRERVWRSAHTGFDVQSTDDGTDETRDASLELLEAMFALQEVETRRWLARAAEPGWLDTGHFIETTVVLTQDELLELGKQISALLEPFAARNRKAGAPADAVRMRAMFRGFPMSSSTLLSDSMKD